MAKKTASEARKKKAQKPDPRQAAEKPTLTDHVLMHLEGNHEPTALALAFAAAIR